MRVMDVLGIRVEMPTNQPVLLLRERDGSRCLPIWVGAAEASSIALAQEGVVPPRPLTHDLLANLVTELGHTLRAVRLTELRDNVYHSVLVLAPADGGVDVEVDARTSDAVAVALRCGASIEAPEAMLEEAGVLLPEDRGEDEVERFKEFLDHVSPEDFSLPDATDD